MCYNFLWYKVSVQALIAHIDANILVRWNMGRVWLFNLLAKCAITIDIQYAVVAYLLPTSLKLDLNLSALS